MKQLFRALIASLVVFLAVPGGARAGQADPFHKEGRGKLSYELDRIARESERGGQVKSMSPAYNRAKGTVTVVIELNAGASPDAIRSIVQAAGGCGPGFHPVPGHWSRWRGGWVPPHCVPNWHGAYGGGYYGRGYYGGGYPYWRNRY